MPIAKKTNGEFICAGQILQIDVTAINCPDRVSLEIAGDTSITKLDELTKRFEWTEPLERNEKIKYKSLEKLKEEYEFPKLLKEIKEYPNGDKDYRITYLIPYETYQTLNSWSTLRKISDDAFNINEKELFSRRGKPYEIVLKVYGVYRSIN